MSLYVYPSTLYLLRFYCNGNLRITSIIFISDVSSLEIPSPGGLDKRAVNAVGRHPLQPWEVEPRPTKTQKRQPAEEDTELASQVTLVRVDHVVEADG